MSNIALVTGASSGIGTELARYHASLGGDLIITARRASVLSDLKRELEQAYGINVVGIPADLASTDGAKNLYDAVKATGMQISILINNAGAGGQGIHIERDLQDELAMVNLNVKSLLELTHRFARDMATQGGGKILQVGSTAGMMPGPLQAVYFATKAFVNSYSQAIDEELRSKGVTCTVLAPGAVNTAFFKEAGMESSNLAKSGKDAPSVAKIGYDAMMKGKLHVINELKLNILSNWIIPLLPRRMVLKIVRRMQEVA